MPYKGSYHREEKLYSKYGGSSSRATQQKAAYVIDQHKKRYKAKDVSLSHYDPKRFPEGSRHLYGDPYPNTEHFVVHADRIPAKIHYYDSNGVYRTHQDMERMEKQNRPKKESKLPGLFTKSRRAHGH